MRTRSMIAAFLACGLLGIVAPKAQAKSAEDKVWSVVDKFAIAAEKAEAKMWSSYDRMHDKKHKNPDKFCRNRERSRSKALDRIYKDTEKLYTTRDKAGAKLIKMADKGVQMSLIMIAQGQLDAIQANFDNGTGGVWTSTQWMFNSCDLEQ